MGRFIIREVDEVLNFSGNYNGGKFKNIYVGLVEKTRNGQKFPKLSLVLAKDIGHPLYKYPVLVNGNFASILMSLKHGQIPFDIDNYDNRDFNNCFLQSLVSTGKISSHHKFPKDIYNYEYEVEGFNFLKNDFLSETKYQNHDEDEGSFIDIARRLKKKETIRIVLPPKKLEVMKPAPVLVKEPPKPSNMGIISYE